MHNHVLSVIGCDAANESSSTIPSRFLLYVEADTNALEISSYRLPALFLDDHKMPVATDYNRTVAFTITFAGFSPKRYLNEDRFYGHSTKSDSLSMPLNNPVSFFVHRLQDRKLAKSGFRR